MGIGHLTTASLDTRLYDMILRLLLALLRRRRPTTTPDLNMFYDMIVYAFDPPL